MKKGRYLAPAKNNNTWIIAFLLFLVVVMGILIIFMLKPDSIHAELPNGETMAARDDVEKNPDSIAIPGYEGITLKADTKQQTVGLPNPPQNTCYFKITLILEDGTVLWQSELVEPGSVSDPIKLNQLLQKGTYPNAMLKYECFTMDGNMKALNSAATKLTLSVS